MMSMNQTWVNWVNYPKPETLSAVPFNSSEAPKSVAHQDLWGYIPKQPVQQAQPAGCHPQTPHVTRFQDHWAKHSGSITVITVWLLILKKSEKLWKILINWSLRTAKLKDFTQDFAKCVSHIASPSTQVTARHPTRRTRDPVQPETTPNRNRDLGMSEVPVYSKIVNSICAVAQNQQTNFEHNNSGLDFTTHGCGKNSD
jgi:hypothetical protein